MHKCLLFLLCTLLILSGCSSNTASTIIEMELTDRYDTSDPFVHEKLFYVPNRMDTLEFTISVQMEGEHAVLELADNETKQVLWSRIWDENVDTTTFPVTLDGIEQEKEYVIRFTGTKIKHAKVVMTSDSKLVKEREKPIKPNRA